MFEDRANEDLGDDLDEGHEPFGDADPGACNAQPGSCDVLAGDLDGPPERSEVPFMEEVMEPFVLERQVFMKHPVDGLPVPVESTKLAEAPKFTYESFVCVGDERRFVEVFDDELSAAQNALIEKIKAIELVFIRGIKANELVFIRGTFDETGCERARLEFEPDRVITRFGQRFVKLNADEHPGPEVRLMPVRPIRERCRHLTSQIFNHDGIEPGEPGHFIVFRNCAVRRSVGGAMMTLRDQAVYACTLREPRDPESEKVHIFGPEKTRLDKADEVVRLPMFHDGNGAASDELPGPTVQ